MRRALPSIAALLAAGPALAHVQTTEWMYNRNDFVEFTHLGPSAVNFTGWSSGSRALMAGGLLLPGWRARAPGQTS